MLFRSVSQSRYEVDPIEQFRFETETFGDSVSYRVRSDVSMLLHAADLAKRVGSSSAQYFMDSRRPKSSPIQEALDKLNPSDDELLSMVKLLIRLKLLLVALQKLFYLQDHCSSHGVMADVLFCRQQPLAV